MAEGLKDEKYRNLISQGVRQGPEMDFLRDRIMEFIASLPAEEAYHGAQKIRLAWAVIRSPEENLSDEHFTEDRDFFAHVEHAEHGRSFTYPGHPAIFSKTPWSIRRRAPLLGEDNDEILKGILGLSAEDLVMLRETKVI